MTEWWWQQPYPGGVVAVPGFPRPLYPPSAASSGRTPSPPGPDVIAYKRVLWRLGRWQGPASRFDDRYSDAFALGAGPNVIDTGIAGLQRQQRIADTGFVGQATFDVLRSAVIPEPLEHAGQFGMDANAANLVAEAWQLFAVEPELELDPFEPPEPATTTRELALAAAQRWIGTTESPAGSNRTPFGAWYGLDANPWCAMFVTYCFELEAGGSPAFVRGSRYAFVPYLVADSRNRLYGLEVTSSPRPGDLVCYDWDRGSGSDAYAFDHVGIFESGTPASFTAVEGNTSTSSDSNGGEVMRRQRSSSSATVVFVRVGEP